MPATTNFNIHQSPDQLTLRIRAARKYRELIAFIIWMLFWAAGEVVLCNKVFYDSPPDNNLALFFQASIGIWSLIGGLVGFRVCWRLFGVEQIQLTKTKIQLEKRIGCIGKHWDIPIGQVYAFRITIPGERPWWVRRSRPLGIFTGKITVDVSGDSHSIGLGLHDAEAYALADLMKKRLSAFQGGN